MGFPDLRPLTSRLRRRFLDERPLQVLAKETLELAPATRRLRKPAIALPGAWARIRAFGTGLHPHEVRRSMEAGEDVHLPTLSRRYTNAVISSDGLFVGKGYQPLAGRMQRPWLSGTPVILERAQLCSDWTSVNYFGDWLLYGLAVELLSVQRRLPVVTTSLGTWLHESRYRALAGLPGCSTSLARVEELWTVDDRPMNAGRVARFHELRTRFRAATHPQCGGPRRVFLHRGHSGAKRQLTNSEEVVAALAKEGFVEVHPESEQPEQLSRVLANAEICVGIEGSAMAHASMLLPADAVMLIIQPPYRFHNSLKLFADAVDLRFAYVVAEGDADAFCQPIGPLLDTLALL